MSRPMRIKGTIFFFVGKIDPLGGVNDIPKNYDPAGTGTPQNGGVKGGGEGSKFKICFF